MSILSKLDQVKKKASKRASLPFLSALSPSPVKEANAEDLAGYLTCQNLAQQGANEIASFITEGWTEIQAAKLLDTWLKDNGVDDFFHHSYAWFGERTRFTGINRLNYWEFMPSKRVIQPGEVFILDVAPNYKGYMCDIGFSSSLGENEEFNRAQKDLWSLRDDIVRLFNEFEHGGKIWQEVDQIIKTAGYDNIHNLYPLRVLGHRVYRTVETKKSLQVLNFGWQSYWNLISRGVFGQILNVDYEGDLLGLWAIEPHIGASNFGIKFEEILVVDADGARWLNPEPEIKKIEETEDET